MSKSKTYEVRLRSQFTHPRRFRAGVELQRGVTQTLELTDEQAEAMKNDKYIDIRKAKARVEETNAGTGDSGVESDTAGQAQESTDEAQDSEAGAAEQEETSEGSDAQESTADKGDSEDPVAALVRKKSRKQLNKMAAKLGIADAEKLPNATEVAKAIVAVSTDEAQDSEA